MPPVVVAAGIAGAATIGGAVLSSSAQKKAANKASQTAADNTTANNALAREMYASNAARLDPFAANGLRASNALSDMLLGSSSSAPVPSALPQTGVQSGGVQTNPVAAQEPYSGPAYYAPPDPSTIQPGIFGAPQRSLLMFPDRYAKRLENGLQQQSGDLQPYTLGNQPQAAPAAGTSAPIGSAAGTSATPTNALSAWDQFRNSTNYQWRANQGLEAINQGYAAKGGLESGAAQKALLEWNQNYAANELGRYQDLLAGQQNMGLTAASALAGVGQGLVGQVTANNNSAASAAANAQLVSGQANANMYAGIGQGVGQIAGALGSSYSHPAAAPGGYITGGGTAAYYNANPIGGYPYGSG